MFISRLPELRRQPSGEPLRTLLPLFLEQWMIRKQDRQAPEMRKPLRQSFMPWVLNRQKVIGVSHNSKTSSVVYHNVASPVCARDESDCAMTIESGAFQSSRTVRQINGSGHRIWPEQVDTFVANDKNSNWEAGKH
jgi:hypothetical protein